MLSIKSETKNEWLVGGPDGSDKNSSEKFLPGGRNDVYLSNPVLISKYTNWWILAIFQDSIIKEIYGNVPEYPQLSVFILEWGWEMKMPKKFFSYWQILTLYNMLEG